MALVPSSSRGIDTGATVGGDLTGTIASATVAKVNGQAVSVNVATALAAALTVDVQTGTSYTLALADAGATVTLNNGSAIALTIPTNATIAFPVGTQILLVQLGAGQVTVAAAGGATVNSRGAALKLNGQYACGALVQYAANTWVLSGDITT